MKRRTSINDSPVALLLAFVMAIVRACKRVYTRAGEEFLKTIEAADADLPVPVGKMTRLASYKLSPFASRIHLGHGSYDTRGQLGLGTVLAAFVLVIAAMVVLIVIDRFDSSLGTPSSSALSESEGDILSGFADMTSLIGPLLLIAIGVVIIGLIRRVQAQ